MGAKIEYDMRAEIFAHYQKLPFSFYDNQKVGQLLSRITSDLFDITELLHHGRKCGHFCNEIYRKPLCIIHNQSETEHLLHLH